MCENERNNIDGSYRKWLDVRVEWVKWKTKKKVKKLVPLSEMCFRKNNQDWTCSLMVNWEMHEIDWKYSFWWVDRVKIVNWYVFWVVRFDAKWKFSLFVWNNIIEINWEKEFNKIPKIRLEKWCIVWKIENNWEVNDFSVKIV
jgi:hypothetical protein